MCSSDLAVHVNTVVIRDAVNAVGGVTVNVASRDPRGVLDATLGFMAQAKGQAVSEVASSGIGLAFIAFPTIINQAPMGALIGVLFFGSLVFAGITSMISIVEVIVAAIQDKLNIGRVNATLLVCIPMGIISTLLFGTTTGLSILDVLDKFVNTYGIVAAGFVYVLAIIALRKQGFTM